MNKFFAICTIVLGLTPTVALACLCRPGEPQNPQQKAEIAFVGRPVKIEVVAATQPELTLWQRAKESASSFFGSAPTAEPPRPQEFLGSVRLTFEVQNYLKGTGPKRFHVMTGYGDSDCGLPVSISKRYTIYARRIEGRLRTSYCFGSGEYRQRRTQPVCHGS
jgi:hypothetical protein